MPAVPRPNFIGIGPGRSGTTWLYRILREHPEVGLAEVKETLYFNREYFRGEDWYLNFFRRCTGKRAIGEICNTYIFDAESAGRIFEFDPRMKLVSCLRNPVDRAFSHYLFLLRNHYARGSFEAVIDSSPDIIERGRYASLLRPYFRTFPRDQMLFLRFDSLQSEPDTVARDLYRFLGVADDFRPQAARERINAASRPRSRLLARLVKSAAIAVRERGHPEVVHRIKESRLARLLYRPVGRGEYPAMGADTREKLSQYYRDDVRALSAMLDFDFEALWLGPPVSMTAPARAPDAELP